MLKKTPEFVAAVDLGSNSFHMIVCSLKDGKLQTIDRLREMVRLASGLDKKNHLNIETQQRALSCLERFGQRIKDFPDNSVRIVGTSTLRTAKNADEFLEKAEKALGHAIHVISGVEEARLIYQGVRNSLGSNASTRLVMDIGGGSTEYIIGTSDTPTYKDSLHMGCVSMSERFFKEGKISKMAFNQAVLFAEQKLKPIQKQFQRKHWNEAIGASGSLKTIDKVLRAKNWSNNGITQEGLNQLAHYICRCDHINQLNLPELDNERLPVFLGGVAIIFATFKSLNIEQMTVSDGALREGLIEDLLGRLADHDIRSTTVNNMAERYHVDKQQAQRVKQTTLGMYYQISQQEHDAFNENALMFLEWACELHELGHDIAHNQYHKHSAYIIRHGDFAGFSHQDQLLLATIVRFHRRKLDIEHFEKLPFPWNEDALKLAVILRLAVLLHRNRQEELPAFQMKFKNTKLKLTFPSQWLDNFPLTQSDLVAEADYLKMAGFKFEFC